MVGLIFNGFFATTNVISLDGVSSSIEGGWLDGNWKQMYKQIAYVAATTAYAFIMTALLAHGLNRIPGLALRASPDDEALGMDDAQIGEFANDYVEVRRDFTDWTPEPQGMKPAGRWDSSEGPTASVHTHHTHADGTGMVAGDRHGAPDVGPDEYEERGAGRDRRAHVDEEKAGTAQSRDPSNTTHVGIAGDRHGGPESGPFRERGDVEKQA